MDRIIFINKLFDYSYSTIPEEKRIIQILLKESKFNEILEIVTKDDEFVWLKGKEDSSSNNKKYIEYDIKEKVLHFKWSTFFRIYILYRFIRSKNANGFFFIIDDYQCVYLTLFHDVIGK